MNHLRDRVVLGAAPQPRSESPRKHENPWEGALGAGGNGPRAPRSSQRPSKPTQPGMRLLQMFPAVLTQRGWRCGVVTPLEHTQLVPPPPDTRNTLIHTTL